MTVAYAGESEAVLPTAASATLHVADYEFGGVDTAGIAVDMHRLEAPLSPVITAELEGAVEYLGVDVEVLLIAALGRAIERVIGPGRVAIDVAAAKERSGGGLAVVRRLEVACVPASEVEATAMLRTVRTALAAAAANPSGVADVMFSYGMALIDGEHPGPAHTLEVRASRSGEVLNLDWWYARRQFEPYTVEEFAEQFSFAVIELASEAMPLAD
ncbi:hypothetical protein BOO86_01610 [Mycobacterium sp. CBMA 234]|uniref:hypothetical protein n=1 Tax=Mycolicibacterium sp. CBMA 234 TaxID=1918495 RepID=UPI0012DCA22F|nr:hypothetical protein [Mycolicibacterium sp. CBMA 234]MUL63147.1 hypothetical protein [Mycolicibacterium sp. CBMA 234]